MRYVAIRSEGGLIPYDLLEQIANEQVPGQKAKDFDLPPERRLTDQIQRVWGSAQELWDNFKQKQATLGAKDAYGTSLTRTSWISPLLTDPLRLGYDLKPVPSALVLHDLTFPVSHRAGEGDDAPPVHIEGFKVDLDRRGPKLRTSPRAMVQEFLNHSEQHLWGIVTNGVTLQLLRNSARTARPTYLEFDLQTILEGNHFHEFALFYRLTHRSRLPRPGEDPTRCLLEQYYQLSIEQGGRVRDKLRDGVEDALKILGTGFLRHPANTELLEKISAGRLKPADYHRQLLRLVYRLLFLMVAEERRLIVATGDGSEGRQRIYDSFYSISRLRDRAAEIIDHGSFSDLWPGLKQTFWLFSDTRDTNPLAIPPLNGDLFSKSAMPDLEATELANHDLLLAIRRLSLFEEKKVLQRVNYGQLNVEELGSVYESLLDFQPVFEKEPEGLAFELQVGSERKTTGSYYTRPELVRELIQSALVPVIEDRLAEADKQAKGKPEDEVTAAKEKAILNMSVCDPACGSGHFLLEAARRLGRELARLRAGQDEPPVADFHLAVRDAISHCIYGVDLNPLAVDLCKLALWLEGHWIGKPLNFLDHRIKCGNSLIGVLDPAVMQAGISDEVFAPVTGDDKKVASAYKKRNKKEREAGQKRLDFEAAERASQFGGTLAEPLDFPEETPADVRRKAELYKLLHERPDWWHDFTAANFWTAAFFLPLTKYDDPVVPTHEVFMDYLRHSKDRPQMTGHANALGEQLKFFHWRLEFPEVFARDGFDVVMGNPPWERIKLQEEEFWADDPHIATAPNKAERTRRIEGYRNSNDPVKRTRVDHFDAAKHAAEATSKFIREGRRFPHTAVGDINTYALFAELARTLLNKQGRAGIIVPTGIATDDTNKEFFGRLNREQALASFFDFENREALFPGVHRSYKFSLFTISVRSVTATSFACFLARTEQIRDPARRFELSPEDFALLNPNTRTCPIFRTRADAGLTKKIYRQVPILLNERTNANPWGIEYLRMLDMSNDSELFETAAGDGLVPLYEGKMVQAYDHRAASVITNVQNLKRPGQPVETTLDQHRDSNYLPRSQYWVPQSEVRDRLPTWYPYKWFLGFKSVTSPTNERTFIATVLPWSGVSNSMPLILTTQKEANFVACLLANLNALVFDYVARQKVGGVNLNFFIINQLTALPPGGYGPADTEFISSRVLALVYTAFDMKGFAKDIGHDGQPFQWDENRRADLRAELDAYFAHLYGLSRDELRYILDPKDVFGPDFPSETFRGLKENEVQWYGEYRTQRLVLAAYDELAKTDRFAGEKRESAIEAPKGRLMVPVK